MTFVRISEPWSPAPESRKQIDEAISCIAPDDAAMIDWFQRYSCGQRKRLTLDVEHVANWARLGDRIVEFGSLPPILTVALTRAGYNVRGLDLKPERFQSTIDSQNLNITKIDFEVEALPMRDGEYDVAIFNEVFEHLRINPIFTMREVHRILKPDGVLMLSTPNLTSWKGWQHFAFKGRLAPDMYLEFSKLDRLGHMGHVRIYSVGEVVSFLRRIGFSIETVVHRGEFQTRRLWERRLVNGILRLCPRLRTSFSVIARKTRCPVGT